MQSSEIELPRLRPYARQGKAYFDELRAYLKEHKRAILNDVATIRHDKKGITVRDVCVLALRYELNLKAMFDFLEDESVLPCGTYDRCKAGGVRPMAALRATWTEMQQSKATDEVPV